MRKHGIWQQGESSGRKAWRTLVGDDWLRKEE